MYVGRSSFIYFCIYMFSIIVMSLVRYIFLGVAISSYLHFFIS